MKTKIISKVCRPILIETKDNKLKFNIFKEFDGSLSYSGFPSNDSNVICSLYIISCDTNENIKEGDMIFINKSKYGLYKASDITDKGICCYMKNQCHKVIATQDQLPLDYIQEFIDNYNSGCMEDIEIEYEFIEPYKYLNEDEEIVEDYPMQPKLTNGLITIIKEKPIYQQIIDTVGGVNKFCELANITKQDLPIVIKNNEDYRDDVDYKINNDNYFNRYDDHSIKNEIKCLFEEKYGCNINKTNQGYIFTMDDVLSFAEEVVKKINIS